MFPSFTNEVGTRVRYSDPVSHTWFTEKWQWYGYLGAEQGTITYPGQLVEISRKPTPYPGDRKSFYPYSRSGQKITKHVPYRYEERHYTWYGLFEHHVRMIEWTFGLVDFINPQTDFGSNAYGESTTEALNALTSNYAGVGANLAQSRKTVDEMSSLAMRLAALLLAFKRREYEEIKRFFSDRNGLSLGSLQKTLADLWLAYQYGIKPLLSDVHEANEAVRTLLKREIHIEGRGGGKESLTWHEDKVLGNYDWEADITEDYSVRTRLTGRVMNPVLYLLNQSGLINPLSIAWELVPWSFAIDWFIPIGNTLQACTAGVGLEYTGGYSTFHKKTVSNIRTKPGIGSPYGDHQWWASGGAESQEGYAFERRLHVRLPFPRLYADTTPYSTPRALNALALIRQLA